MAISKKDVKDLSVLARIGVDEKEIEPIQKDLEKILEFISKLKQAPGTDIEQSAEVSNELREDRDPHQSGEYTEDLLSQVPELERGFVKVKKVFDND